jgi:hypothetical protein
VDLGGRLVLPAFLDAHAPPLREIHSAPVDATMVGGQVVSGTLA